MIPKIVLGGSLSVLCCLGVFAQFPAVGGWQEHLPYHQAIAVVNSASKVWCATPYSLFSVDMQDNSLSRLSRINGLSETGISAINIDSANNKLIIAYTSSNIDILSGSQIFNIPDLKQAPVTGNRTVHQVFVYNNMAYLATGLGIVVLDEGKYEVSDTYIIGNNGDTVAVNALTTDGSFFYAATDEGLKQAPIQSPDLADFHSWLLLSGAAGLGAGPCQQVTNWLGKILVLQDDSLFQFNVVSGNWNFFYADGWQINELSVSSGKLLVCEQHASAGPGAGVGRVLSLKASGAVESTLQQAGLLQSPRQAIFLQGGYYVADSVDGLSAWTGTGTEQIIPNSPQSIATGELTIGNSGATGSGGVSGGEGVLWAAAGGADSNWAPLNNHSGLYRFDGNNWTNYNASVFSQMDSIFDFVSVAVNPRDNSVWAGSFGEGLLQIRADNSFTIYAGNSPLSPVQGQPGVYRVGGLAFDPDGNLWIANYGAAMDLLLRKADSSWHPFTIPFPHTENAVSQVLVDENRQVWIVSPKGNGLFCYNHGASLDNTSDDQWKYYQVGRGNGNLPDNNVYCVARDRSGFIWVGTANGIGVIQCVASVFGSGGCDAVWPVVQFDNFAGYLFSGQPVQAIAVDGADRKWIGTNNGVWLISPDAQKIIYHFTQDSTPLLSNNIKRIAVDPATGEVFFATDKGICSFRGTATQGGESNSNVLVFPNPVPPGYTGAIAIRGLAEDAIVKITELGGRLIYQTTALGGQAIWNGRDYKGRRVATGVYLVLVSDDTRQEKMATKIVFIGK